MANIDEKTLPIWQEWRGWLFWLAASIVIICVIGASAFPTTSLVVVSGATSARGDIPDPVPAVAPLEFAPLSAEDAVSRNAAIPLVTLGFVPAQPFTYAGPPDQRERALDCLTAAMLYEAGDDVRGQLAVGQVVINRARNPAFPKSICAVVFQGSERVTGCQFTFTCDGALSRRYSDAAWGRARANAGQMLDGKVATEVGLATHYHTNWVRPYWSDSLEKIAAVDTHLFFRWMGFWGTAPAFRNTISGVEPIIAKLAAIAPSHRSGLFILDQPQSMDDDAAAAVIEARAKATVGERGNRDMFLVQISANDAPESFLTKALSQCGLRAYCKLLAWTDPAMKPEADKLNEAQRQSMSFSYLRDDSNSFEKALWNCDQFPRNDARQCMKR